EIAKELKRYTDFGLLFHDLVRSPTDYGEINLDNPQHVVLLFDAAGKYLMSNYEAQTKSEEDAIRDAKHQQALWKIKKEYSPEPGSVKSKTYKTALPDTGASIAYYLGTHGSSLTPADTVIIGKKQPWDPSPTNSQSRGIDFVNHPMHMTSP